jgi:hypothetical protein
MWQRAQTPDAPKDTIPKTTDGEEDSSTGRSAFIGVPSLGGSFTGAADRFEAGETEECDAAPDGLLRAAPG